MSLRANRQRCGTPPTSIVFILQLGFLWSSFTSLPSDLSSTDASRLKKKSIHFKSTICLLYLDRLLIILRYKSKPNNTWKKKAHFIQQLSNQGNLQQHTLTGHIIIYNLLSTVVNSNNTCKQGNIHYYLPPTFPFPFKVKQECCFCVIVVLCVMIMFEKFTTVFKQKISFAENFCSQHTSTFKIRKNKLLIEPLSSLPSFKLESIVIQAKVKLLFTP